MAESTNLSEGAAVRRKVLGGAFVDRNDAGRDPFLAPFTQLATEHAWGAVWTRPGLELKQRSLAVISALIALGRTHELLLHFRGALNVGWTPEELREVCLQLSAYAGFPAGLDALTVLNQVVKQVESEK
jgi:4-carboxymuconolactone decarboxylase